VVKQFFDNPWLRFDREKRVTDGWQLSISVSRLLSKRLASEPELLPVTIAIKEHTCNTLRLKKMPGETP
jgi:hypothetical protein